jgi:hypothetical protein
MTNEITSAPAPVAPHEAVFASRAERAALQVGHRFGSAALLVLIGGAAALFSHKPHAALLLFAFGCADVGLLGAFVALVLGRRAGRRSGEARGTVLFCAAVLLVTIALLVVSRLREPAP